MGNHHSRNNSSDTPAPDLKFYSIKAISWAAFVASWFASAVLISRNYSRLGNNRAAVTSILLGVLSLVPLTIAILFIEVPEEYEKYLPLAFQGAQVIIAEIAAKHFLGDVLALHEEKGGQFYGFWRTLGVSLLALPVYLIVSISSFMFITDEPPKEIEVRIEVQSTVKEGDCRLGPRTDDSSRNSSIPSTAGSPVMPLISLPPCSTFSGRKRSTGQFLKSEFGRASTWHSYITIVLHNSSR